MTCGQHLPHLFHHFLVEPCVFLQRLTVGQFLLGKRIAMLACQSVQTRGRPESARHRKVVISHCETRYRELVDDVQILAHHRQCRAEITSNGCRTGTQVLPASDVGQQPGPAQVGSPRLLTTGSCAGAVSRELLRNCRTAREAVITHGKQRLVLPAFEAIDTQLESFSIFDNQPGVVVCEINLRA